MLRHLGQPLMSCNDFNSLRSRDAIITVATPNMFGL